LTVRFEGSGCSGVSKGKLAAKKIPAPTGDDRLTFKGLFTQQPDLDPIDPSTDGVRLIDHTTLFDVAIPGGSGWTRDPALTNFTFKSATGVQGIIGVKVKRNGKTPGHYKFTVKGKGGDFTALRLPESLSIAFGDAGDPDPTDCAAGEWPGDRRMPYKPVVSRAGAARRSASERRRRDGRRRRLTIHAGRSAGRATTTATAARAGGRGRQAGACQRLRLSRYVTVRRLIPTTAGATVRRGPPFLSYAPDRPGSPVHSVTKRSCENT
jgi:hypothetical protein